MSLKIRIIKKDLKTTENGFQILSEYKVRTALLAQVIRAELMNARAGNAHTKTRGEVRGGGKKPWRQKGTGRARHGSRRSPIWIGGGITHGPRNDRNWSCKINKTSRIAALKSILRDRLDGKNLLQLEDGFDFPKTKDVSTIIDLISNELKAKPNECILIYATGEKEKTRGFSATSIETINATNLKIHKLANNKIHILTPNARKVLEERIIKK